MMMMMTRMPTVVRSRSARPVHVVVTLGNLLWTAALFVLVAVVVVLVPTAQVVDAGAVTVCPKAGSIQKGLRYHHDGLCDRAEYNQFKNALGRPSRYQSFKAIGGVSTVPSEKTVKCPAGGAPVDLRESQKPAAGLDTVFFFENASSGPIVISFVDEFGMEHSARNPAITPATADPEAYVAPGGFMAVYAFEGHQFIAREVIKETGLAGNVLLQHRAGLIPVGTYAVGLDCPDVDIEPVVENTNVRAPEFRRTPPAVHRPCNTMDIGFRNESPCPLHVYYVSAGTDPNSCSESFKFHLGVESVVPDFHWDWQSQTKFEGSFIGHTFHFRLASNPTILVDTVTLSPVVVTDCPKSATPVTVAVHGQAVPIPIGAANGLRDALDTIGTTGGGGMMIMNMSHSSVWDNNGDDATTTNSTRVQGFAQTI
jgi:hypothetical protein